MPPATFNYEKNEAFEELATGSDAIFESRTRFLVFAASVGYARDRWVSDPGDEGEIRWNYINQDQRLSVITKALTYAHTDEPESILDAEAQIDTLVGYGAGGTRIIKAEVVDEPGENLDNLIEFLRQHRDEEESEQRAGILEQIETEMSTLRQRAESE